MNKFSFKLINSTNYKKVSIDLYLSTEGYFIETSQGLVSEYYKTKKEAVNYIKTVKSSIKTEINN
jgi:hypothetical protein